MMENHFIQYIFIETDKGFMMKELHPDEKPCAEFVLADGEKAVAAYEYCNLHGLWKADI
jgi:superoxide reductase